MAIVTFDDLKLEGILCMCSVRIIAALLAVTLVAACSVRDDDSANGSVSNAMLSNQLKIQIETATGQSITALRIPDSTEWDLVPQDPNNPVTAKKVKLGQLLYHDTAFSTAGFSSDQSGSWSCATCHHAAAGFKAGIAQGIGEGGVGFGVDGSSRVLSPMFDANSESEHPKNPDIQPFASPTILNTAYQDVMLWNGQFGNSENGIVNSVIPDGILMTPDTPKESNNLGLAGLEIQAIAGQGVHRLDITEDSIILSNDTYSNLYTSAFADSSEEVRVNAGKAIAAFERTVLANKAPFQKWIRGDVHAMSDAELRGGIVFFGKANCSDCHQGPALSSKLGASAEDVFMAVGFADFDSDEDERVHGTVSEADRNGRGGFSGVESDNAKFKVPQLYNLADANVFGHGASFASIREVLHYKNEALAQKGSVQHLLDHRFNPLQLSEVEIDDLEAFLNSGLYDPNLMRYQPSSVPSGSCVVVDPLLITDDFACR